MAYVQADYRLLSRTDPSSYLFLCEVKAGLVISGVGAGTRKLFTLRCQGIWRAEAAVRVSSLSAVDIQFGGPRKTWSTRTSRSLSA